MRLMVRDVARLLNISEKTVYRWISAKKLPVYRIGDQYRFDHAEILEWASAAKVKVAPELLQDPEQGIISVPAIGEALLNGGIYYRVEGRSRDEVLRSVVKTLRLPENTSSDVLYQVLRAREVLGTTAVGGGVAIPHPRNPLVLFVARPWVSLCFLENPIDFGALDGSLVKILFIVLSPSVKVHLHLLAKLGFLLRDPAVREVLERPGRREEIISCMRTAEDRMEARETVEK